MNILKESDFRKEIKTAPRTAYLFFGDEDYLKLSAVRLAHEALCPDPSFSVFNEMRLDATDFTADRLVDALMPMPMMADRKLIVLSGLDFTSMKPNDLDALCDALSATREYDYNTVLVLRNQPQLLLLPFSGHSNPTWGDHSRGSRPYHIPVPHHHLA